MFCKKFILKQQWISICSDLCVVSVVLMGELVSPIHSVLSTL